MSSLLLPLSRANVGTPEDKASIIELEQQSDSVAETNISVFCILWAISVVLSGGRHVMFS